MANMKPFISIRPQRGKAAEIAALPYDVYNREEATEYVKNHPNSFLKIDRAETQFPISVDTYDDRVYELARKMLWDWVEDGTLIREDKSCYYIYELTMQGRVQTGIVACASVDDYQNNVIKKHEKTREEKEEDRIQHVGVCGAQTGPIFLAYRASEYIDAIVMKAKEQDAEYDFVADDNVRHRVFVIRDDEVIQNLSDAFSQVESVYIADGHHRAASAVKVALNMRKQNPDYRGDESFNYFLSVLFPHDQLMIMDYNRVIKDMNGYSFDTFLREVEDRFDVRELSSQESCKPCERGVFHMYMENRWFACKIRPEDRNLQNPVKDLDVSILQDKLLEPVLDIKDPKTDSRIDFVGGIRGMEELVRRCETDCAVAFAMYPTAIEDLFAVADEELLMPPKSTWFEPKLRSGLFIHEI